MDTAKLRRTVSLFASAALISSLTVAVFAAPAAAKPDEQQEAVKQARVEARAEAKAAREAAKQARAEAKGEKVTLCHKPGTPAERTLEVSAAALDAHLAHGDDAVACDTPAPESVTDCDEAGTSGEGTSTTLAAGLAEGEEAEACDSLPAEPVTICHKPGTSDEETFTIPAAAAPAHRAHGDFAVACDQVPQVLVSISAPDAIDPQVALWLQGEVSGLTSSDVSYEWSSTCLTDEELTDPLIIDSDANAALLVIRENILTPGTTCDFTLTATDEASWVEGSATVQVTLLP